MARILRKSGTCPRDPTWLQCEGEEGSRRREPESSQWLARSPGGWRGLLFRLTIILILMDMDHGDGGQGNELPPSSTSSSLWSCSTTMCLSHSCNMMDHSNREMVQQCTTCFLVSCQLDYSSIYIWPPRQQRNIAQQCTSSSSTVLPASLHGVFLEVLEQGASHTG